MAEEKDPIELVINLLNKKYGIGTINKFSDEPIRDVNVVSTGSFYLDNALGIGGLPYGRLIEIFGAESSGKSTLALTVAGNVQKEGRNVAYIDTEHSLDPVYADSLGVNVNELYISQPDYGEQALDIVETLVQSGKFGCIIIDSVAGLVPKVELDGEMGQSHMGVMARLMSQAMRKLAGVVSKTNCCVIFTNQIREKIGQVYGPTKTTTGGNALKFYASIRLEVKKISTFGGTKEDDPVGNKIKVVVAKNKLAPPFREAEFDLLFGVGIDKLGEIVDLGSELKIIEKSGSWYSYKGNRLGQGKDNVKEFLISTPEICKEIEQEIIKCRQPKDI